MDELKKLNYTYFNQPDYQKNKFRYQKYITTPFEDNAIYKLHRVYVGVGKYSADIKDRMSKDMVILNKFSTDKDVRLNVQCQTMMNDCGFELGFVAFDMFGVHLAKNPRSLFY